MIANLKRALLDQPLVLHPWARYRARQTERRFAAWQEHYGRIARQTGLFYSVERTRDELRKRLRNRCPTLRKPGGVHSLIVTLTGNWGLALVQELEHLGPTSVFDWEKFGFLESDPALPGKLPELNARILEFVRDAHRRCPIDWILITASGNVILRDTLRRIRDELGVPTIQQWLDCKQNFAMGKGENGQDRGQRDIASEFDLIWTSSRAMCEAYLCEGALPLYLPEGFSPRMTPRVDCAAIHDVGFMGARYGLRPDYVRALAAAGIHTAVRGPGWNAGRVPLSEMGRFFAECKVNLGFGGVGYSMELTTLKGRDFEVPGAGGVYLTSYNEDLREWFRLGEEIVCYRSIAEMVELASALLNDPSRRQCIAAAAYSRSMREHRWLHRYEKILQLFGILPEKQNA